MCHFLAPAGQPEMMHENFMHWHLCIFVVRMLMHEVLYPETGIDREISCRYTLRIKTACEMGMCIWKNMKPS